MRIATTRVSISKSLRSAHARSTGGSDAATAALAAAGYTGEASVVAPGPIADAVATWCGYRLETAAASIESAPPAAAGRLTAEAQMYASAWLKLVAAGAEDGHAEPETLATAKSLGAQTWRALTNAQQARVSSALKYRG